MKSQESSLAPVVMKVEISPCDKILILQFKKKITMISGNNFAYSRIYKGSLMDLEGFLQSACKSICSQGFYFKKDYFCISSHEHLHERNQDPPTTYA